MAKHDKSSVLIASNLGHHALVFNEDDVVRLLRAAVEREGGQTAFAKRHGVDRTSVNRVLNGKLPASGSIAKALGLRRVYVAE
jgi:DNA-binding phage protein